MKSLKEFSLAKRLTEIQKKEITQFFKNGKNIDLLSREFNCSKLTIIRTLKKDLGDVIYKALSMKNRKSIQEIINEEIENNIDFGAESCLKTSNNNTIKRINLDKKKYETNFCSDPEFIEISPLDFEIENIPRKELSSIPIGDIEFPKIVYMIVDKNIELEVKLLKDYPNWEFLPNEDLNRKTIEIFFDLKTAKRFCSKEKKVIKVPNTDVFRIVSPILISRGITRIVSSEQLIAL